MVLIKYYFAADSCVSFYYYPWDEIYFRSRICWFHFKFSQQANSCYSCKIIPQIKLNYCCGCGLLKYCSCFKNTGKISASTEVLQQNLQEDYFLKLHVRNSENWNTYGN